MRQAVALAALALAACQQAVAPAEADANVAEATLPVAAPAAKKPAPIPANFHGLWAANDSACAHLTDASRLTVTGNSVRYPAFVLAVESATHPTPNSFAVKGYNKQTKRPAEAHFSIDETGNLLTDEADGAEVRVRCT